ncbi:MAG: glycosyltransferase [Dehalobacter sp.]|nr:glycosyltransferase [Dehalobacter sp.]
MVKLNMLITSLSVGGAERCVSELSLNLDPSIEREIITILNNNSYPVKDPIISMNMKIGSPKVFYVLVAFIFGIFKYRRIMKESQANVSMSFLVLDNFINIISNIGNKNVKKIISVHIALSEKFSNRYTYSFTKYIIRHIYGNADSIVAVSDGVKEELITEYGIDQNKIVVIYNPIDIINIDKLSKELIIDDELFNGKNIIVFNMGRLTEQKGQWHLIRAFSKVRKSCDCILVIRGDGHLKTYLESLIRDLNLSDSVKFLGWKENPYKYIAQSALFVFPSLWEALPYAIIESMACGCPIVSTDCKYGPREILGDNKYGVLIGRFDNKLYNYLEPLTIEEERLADVIIQFLNDENYKMYYKGMALKRSQDYNMKNSLKSYEYLINSKI